MVAGPLVLKECAAHLVQVVGDNGVQAWPRAAPVASGDDGDAAPGRLRRELVARELGRQPGQLRWYAGYANHGTPAGIMMCLSPSRSVIAAAASLPAAVLDVFHTEERDAVPRAGAVLSRLPTCDNLGLHHKYEWVL